MRTTKEIIAKIEQHKGDFFGFIASDLLLYVSYADALPYLNEEAKKNDELRRTWEIRDQAGVLDELKDYMTFAWGKANDCRGLSASRSIEHMRAWLWMLGEDEASEAISDYDKYGKPQLAAICEHYGIDWAKLDDGRWSSSEDGPDCGDHTPASLPWRVAVEVKAKPAKPTQKRKAAKKPAPKRKPAKAKKR